jgi:hypothetical protein
MGYGCVSIRPFAVYTASGTTASAKSAPGRGDGPERLLAALNSCGDPPLDAWLAGVALPESGALGEAWSPLHPRCRGDRPAVGAKAAGGTREEAGSWLEPSCLKLSASTAFHPAIAMASKAGIVMERTFGAMAYDAARVPPTLTTAPVRVESSGISITMMAVEPPAAAKEPGFTVRTRAKEGVDSEAATAEACSAVSWRPDTVPGILPALENRPNAPCWES